MTRKELIDLVVDYAMLELQADDANPDVGMGMGPLKAVRLAEAEVFREAARWNSLAALALDFNEIRLEVLDTVILKRHRR